MNLIQKTLSRLVEEEQQNSLYAACKRHENFVAKRVAEGAIPVDKVPDLTDKTQHERLGILSAFLTKHDGGAYHGTDLPMHARQVFDRMNALGMKMFNRGRDSITEEVVHLLSYEDEAAALRNKTVEFIQSKLHPIAAEKVVERVGQQELPHAGLGLAHNIAAKLPGFENSAVAAGITRHVSRLLNAPAAHKTDDFLATYRKNVNQEVADDVG